MDRSTLILATYLVGVVVAAALTLLGYHWLFAARHPPEGRAGRRAWGAILLLTGMGSAAILMLAARWTWAVMRGYG